ncbi:hypothetical protein [Fontibacter flavus]|uniref:DUF5034 domain-containing protein n=1 Tax=Fontibacter flavus TaxID=654838 RepID=A0ABV6FW77_9BACT
MKGKIFLLWLFMIVMGVLPTACDLFCRDSCGCRPLPPARNFIITDFSTEDFVLNITNFDPESYYDRDKYFKVIQVAQIEFITENTSKSPGISFISAAYACDPIQGISEQRLISLEIINLKETVLSETETLMVGQNISDRFNLTDFPQFPGKAIAEFIQQENYFRTGESLLLQWKDELNGGTLDLEFTIILKLDDGKEFIFEHELMKIK